MPVLTSTQGNKPIMPYVRQGQMVPMMTPQAQQMQSQLRPAAAREQAAQPDQRPQAAMVNGGEEIIPAPIVQALGGSQAVTSMLNAELGKRGLPPLSGDKGTVGQYANQPMKPANMACGTVGERMMKNYATGTVGITNPTQPEPAAGPNYTTDQTAQGATNVLGTAQTKAVGGFTSPTAAATSTATQNLLKAPTTAPNYVPTALQGFDVNRAKAYEAYRQKTAPISNTAANRDEMMNLALQGAIDRSQFENQLTQEQEATDWNRRLQALGEGRATTGMEQGIWSGDIGALTAVRGAGEGEAARTWQTAENSVGREFEMGKLVSIQDFDREMKQLDTDLAKALQSGDIQAQKDLLDKQAYYTQKRDEVAQQWQTAERVATQGWQTGERIGTQDFAAGQAYLDRQQQLAVQANDIEAQKYIETQKANLALQMQTQDMAQQEKMAYLNSQLEDARAERDVGRQMQIIGFQTQQDLQKIVQQQGYEAGQKELDRRFEEAMQGNDIAAQFTLQQERIALQREQMSQDRFLETARQELTARGLDMQQIQMRYDQIQSAIEAGQADPSAARDFLNQTLKTSGIQLAPPDPNAERIALQRDWNNQQYQWALSHSTPDMVTMDAQGNITGLTEAGAGAFSTWFNDTIYGNANADALMSGEKPVTTIIGKPDSPDYAAVSMRATPFSADATPVKGQYFTDGGKLYYVESDMVAGGAGGANHVVVDVSTGARGSLNPTTMTGGRYTGWEINGFGPTTATYNVTAPGPAPTTTAPAGLTDSTFG